MKRRSILITLMTFLLMGCQTSIEPEYGLVTWYLSNSTGTRTTLNIYDKVCERSHFRIRVPRTGESPLQTCANSEGNGEIRYQRTGGYSGSDNPWIHSTMRSNQTLMIR
ncbi:MAG: hypothetical protein HOF74_14060 [Gammaproteobacteria bacterium]|jgi:hypothetical protein|nr:hypothetical protein [Gammaproteobacteria bacterium]MBT3860953.1 hypothetical protein [Gammaproteobacteria bacterium]MBT3988476.1 hypothetical protein [Gammaproteobacteria bacterium]MBT4256187.1 hypothetical protein [Gammaproteobacteria bacterium]MBT4581326.1 hypothetical protein [Gammaproteobacteria bacterium]